MKKKSTLMRNVAGNISAIDWKDKVPINNTHKGLLVNPQMQRPGYYHAETEMSELSSKNKIEGGLHLLQ